MNKEGLDLLLALADGPEGCRHAHARFPTQPHREGDQSAAAGSDADDEMDMLCRMADEAEAAMVPGSPAAADVPFDADDDDDPHDPEHDTLASDAPAMRSGRRMRQGAGPHSAPRASTAAVADDQQKGKCDDTSYHHSKPLLQPVSGAHNGQQPGWVDSQGEALFWASRPARMPWHTLTTAHVGWRSAPACGSVRRLYVLLTH